MTAMPAAAESPPASLQASMQEAIREIGAFAVRPPFQRLLQDLYGLPESERARFVADVVLNPEERSRRGIELPDGLIIQRSAFADARPTLFCVTKYLPQASQPWRKVTVTFDSA